jgi:hypothetical protein
MLAVYGLTDEHMIAMVRDFWDAATYAASTRAGDAGNEAEKDARRKVAIVKFSEALKWNSVCTHGEESDYCDCCRYDWEKRIAALPVLVDAIIKEAQG